MHVAGGVARDRMRFAWLYAGSVHGISSQMYRGTQPVHSARHPPGEIASHAASIGRAADSLCSRSHVFESKLPEPRVQLHPRYSELLGRPYLVAIGIPHDAFNCTFFKGIEISDARQWNIRPRSQAKVLGIDNPS